MSPKTREELRLLILVALSESLTVGARQETLLLRLARDVRGIDGDLLDAELTYLKDKGFCRIRDKAISPENKRWEITADGRDFLATEGLA